MTGEWIVTRDQALALDLATQTEFGIPAEFLMESAGVGCAAAINAWIKTKKISQESRIVVVCGPGNNGADGLVVARHLYARGYSGVQVGTIVHAGAGSSLFQKQLGIAKKIGFPIVDLLDQIKMESSTSRFFSEALVVVDAIFGVGLDRKIENPFRQVILDIRQYLKSKSKKVAVSVIAIDGPSGIHSTTGDVMGICLPADLSLILGPRRLGFELGFANDCLGQQRFVEIGIPPQLVREKAVDYALWTGSRVRDSLGKRSRRGNKSTFGRSLVIAGSAGMWGAGVLTSQAAYRSGSGYVHWMSPEFMDLKVTVKKALVNSEILPCVWSDASVKSKKWDAIAIGPGLGRSSQTEEKVNLLMEQSLQDSQLKIVADADAISAIAELCKKQKARTLSRNWVLTPHSAELGRCLELSAEEVEQDRVAAAKAGANRLNCWILLKGFHSLLTDGERVWILKSGNVALAKAGTGDVLTGMILGFLAQGHEVFSAAGNACYLHGQIAKEWVQSGHSTRSLLPGDLLTQLPLMIAKYESEVGVEVGES